MNLSAIIALAAVSQFVLVDRKDPITDTRQIAYAATSENNVLAIGCSDADRDELFVRLVPDRYYGPDESAMLWEPNALYRFGDQKPNKDKWFFMKDSIELGFLFGEIKAKARFIDALSKSSVLHIRYEAEYGETETVSFLYEISKEQLSFVLKTCNPKKVNKLLREMGTDLDLGPVPAAK
jgi:hypothetical protein